MVKFRAMPKVDDRGMNKTEAAYALVLDEKIKAGEYAYWEFERITLRIGKDGRTTYTPDFSVYGVGGELTFHEVKGFWRDDARVKIKVAAHQFPQFNFVAVQKVAKKHGGGWKVERF